MKHLIVGYGEVGQALHKIFPEAEIQDVDKGKVVLNDDTTFDVMHVCFPCPSKIDFITQVSIYKEKFKPRITIVHSSVPIGTCDQVAAVHSPIRGVHPKLEEGIRTFKKFFGGAQAQEAAIVFMEKGIDCETTPSARTTEAAKLWDTTQYGVMILLEKEIHKFCEENNLDFETIYTKFNEDYARGYQQLGMAYVARPWLVHIDGPIGGHCVVQNAALLDTPSAKRIIDENIQLQK